MNPPSYAPAIAGGYSAPMGSYTPPAQQAVSPPMPRASNARMGRRMMRRMVRGGSAIGKTMFGVRPGLVIAFILVLLLTGWFAYDKWMTGSNTINATPNAVNKNGTITLPPETAAVQSYLTAVQKGDTDAVWNSLGAQEKAHRISRGDDKSVLDAVLKAQQQQGFTYTAYHYVAGYGKNGAADPDQGRYLLLRRGYRAGDAEDIRADGLRDGRQGTDQPGNRPALRLYVAATQGSLGDREAICPRASRKRK